MTSKAAVDDLGTILRCIKAVAFKQSDEAWASLDLTMAQLKAFMLIVHSGGITSSALADKMRVSPSAVTPVVDKLVAHELARREDDPGDRRVHWVRPTPAALAQHERLLASGRALHARILGAVPADKAAAVQEALAVLVDAARAVKEQETAS